MQLVCPAGSLPSLKAAVDNGANAVYTGFRDQTNARAFPGLNFSEQDLRAGIDYARQRSCAVYIALNTYPGPANFSSWQRAVDTAADLGIDAIICADIAVLDYACNKQPGLARHLSVQASATTHEALRFYKDRFDIQRAVLPRVLSIQQVERLCAKQIVPIEVFAFGSLCIMVEGRCQLSSYITGASPNRDGVCSPAKFVQWHDHADGEKTVRLNSVLIDRFAPNEPACYPTVCKGRYQVEDKTFHALEEPTSLNTLSLLSRLHRAGVSALKIEGRQRSQAYVASVTRVWRDALNQLEQAGDSWSVQETWMNELAKHAEGHQTTLGPYHRKWQ